MRRFLIFPFAILTCTTQAHATEPACPGWLNDKRLSPAAPPYTCRCAPGIERHSAYGVFRYHSGSHLCTAARHDGRIGLRGGTITVYFGHGCAFYREAWRNNVQSRRKGASRVSFAFARPLPPCSPRPKRLPKRNRTQDDDEDEGDAE
jgi:hypothetical protein